MCVFVSIKTDIFQVPFRTMNRMGGGEIPPSHWRTVRGYLLFKQIEGPLWQRTLNLAPLQMFKSPSEGIGVLLRNEQLLGQNSLWIPGWTANSDVEPLCWLASRHAEHSPGSWCLGGSGDCQAAAQLTQISLCLMCVRPFAQYTNYGEYLLLQEFLKKAPLVRYKKTNKEKWFPLKMTCKWWQLGRQTACISV